VQDVRLSDAQRVYLRIIRYLKFSIFLGFHRDLVEQFVLRGRSKQKGG